jgi:hypothetical protein
MKLTPDQAEHARAQMKADVIPKNHPMLWQLSDLFGEHTFFLDTDGLAIVDAPPRDGSRRAERQVVHLANWTDANRTSLVPHKPTPTGQQVAL